MKPSAKSSKLLQVIIIEEASENNLKNISCGIPRHRLVVVTGPSGAGKTSLVFDTIHSEFKRRFLVDDFYSKKPDVKAIKGLPFTVAIEAIKTNSKLDTIASLTGTDVLLENTIISSGDKHCPKCDEVIKIKSTAEIVQSISSEFVNKEITIALGLGEMFPKELLAQSDSLISQGYTRLQIADMQLRLDEQAFVTIIQEEFDEKQKILPIILVDILKVYPEKLSRLSEIVKQSGNINCRDVVVLSEDKEQHYLLTPICAFCGVVSEGTNKLFGKKLLEILQQTIDEVANLSQEKENLVQLNNTLQALQTLGLGYLSLDRPLNTLSTGEMQRIKLASYLTQDKSHLLYLVDEPSRGLHPEDVKKLIQTLKEIVDNENSIIAIEHHQQVIASADYCLELGPGSGARGGEVTYAGSEYKFPKNNSNFVETKYSSENKTWLQILGLSKHNLQNISLKIPLNSIVVVAGVSGSGKSSAIRETLVPVLKASIKKEPISDELSSTFKEVLGWNEFTKVVDVNDMLTISEDTVSRPRSVVATAVDILQPIRELFSKTVEAKVRGYSSSHFSFNTKEGQCSSCSGKGENQVVISSKKIINEVCAKCQGTRYAPQIKQLHFKEHSIVDVLSLSIEEAKELFLNIPDIKKILDILSRIGLSYLSLGQKMETLSLGEQQRLYLAKALVKNTGKTLFVFDEPTRGLHQNEINFLVSLLQEAIKQGHSIIAIEHNLQLMRSADYLIELGPGAGSDGGNIIAEGTYEELCSSKESLIATYLKANY